MLEDRIDDEVRKEMLKCKLEVLTSCYIRRLDKSSESASRKHSVVVEFTLVRSHLVGVVVPR